MPWVDEEGVDSDAARSEVIGNVGVSDEESLARLDTERFQRSLVDGSVGLLPTHTDRRHDRIEGVLESHAVHVARDQVAVVGVGDDCEPVRRREVADRVDPLGPVADSAVPLSEASLRKACRGLVGEAGRQESAQEVRTGLVHGELAVIRLTPSLEEGKGGVERIHELVVRDPYAERANEFMARRELRPVDAGDVVDNGAEEVE